MTKITLSTGDKYTIETPASKIMRDVHERDWLTIEDNGRDIAIRCAHIIAIEEDTAAIIKESELEALPKAKSFLSLGGKLYRL